MTANKTDTGERPKTRFVLLKAAAVFLISVIVIAGLIIVRDSGRVIDRTHEIDKLTSGVLKQFSITDKDLVRETKEEMALGRRKYFHVYRQYKAPKDVSLHDVGESLTGRLKRTHFRIAASDYHYAEIADTARFEIKFKRFDIFSLRLDKARDKKPRYAARKYKDPKVAIVLDDFGYNNRNVGSILAMNIPITFSILPNQAYSTKISEEADAGGREVILHMPLEPIEEDVRLEPDTITTKMSRDEIRDKLQAAAKSIPHLKGISNHMGSKAMQDEEVVTTMITFMEDKGIFFLDSLVADRSLAKEIAKRRGVRFAERSVFLDNEKDPEYIRGQLYKLRDAAFRTGEAIGIGHDRTSTVKVLAEVLPELQEEGIRFVYASELSE
ncbi:divergent polysaccharide deacetylase family protein [Candidatus Omnitrophota bacterium]